MGINPIVKRWERQHTYGGSLVENIVQAVARDIMAAAMVRCEASGIYEIVLTVHDEIVAEAPIGQGTVHAFESLLTELPDWASGCPIAAEGWKGLRYHK
jgi:DNA polymerase